jgi:ribosomal protein S18 acetylase RimI-like enzyme
MLERKWMVREGSVIDIARASELLHKCFLADEPHHPANFAVAYEAYTNPSLLRALMEGGGHLLIAEDSGMMLGCAYGGPDHLSAGFGTYYCAGIAVHPQHRYTGIGTSLLSEIEKRASEIGCHKIYCLVYANNAPALALLKQAGFTEEGLLKRHWSELDFYFVSRQLSSNG